jgi:hypothetical protein
MSASGKQLSQLVKKRAGGKCEYCGMDQRLQGATFHVEHAVTKSRGGADEESNRAWCCPSCNLHKSDRIVSKDPLTQEMVPLFNPRTDVWAEHFVWRGYLIVGTTPYGRAAVAALDLNHPRRVLIRRAEEKFGLFQPR